MTGKHYSWHRNWRWDESGRRLLHDSGLIVEYDKEMGWVATEESCEPWAAFEHSRGVQFEQLAPRLIRLCREAAMWAERNKPHKS